jgi:Right handed beta helix region
MFGIGARLTRLSERGASGRRAVGVSGLAACVAGLCVSGLAAVAPAAAAGAATAAAAVVGRGPGAAVVWQTVTVTTLGDPGPGSLRWAIGRANGARRGRCTRIDFVVSGVIRLHSALPRVSACAAIDGTSAPGYRTGRPPRLVLNFGGQPGLEFAPGSAGSQLAAVAVDGASGDGVTLRASRITLSADYIGLTASGRPAGNRGNGVYVSPLSGHDRIGVNPSGRPGAVSNVISGNGGSGIVLAGSSSDTVAANRIGTNPAGTAAIGNQGDGILITARAHRNEIGGTAYTDPATGQQNNPTGSKGTTTPVFVVPPLGNLISGNGGNGVLIDRGSTRNTLNGNFIGTSASGNSGLGNRGNGVWISHANRNELIGCTFVNNPFVYYNVVSGNGANGLRITDSDHVTVQGNFFGVGANNTTPVGNRWDGILVDGWSASTQVGGVIPLGNVAADNGANGIEVTGHVRGFTTFNTFGGLLAFKGAAPNGHDGLLITSTGGDNLVRTNVFSGNAGNGIEIAGNAAGVTVEPDIAGLNTKGNGVLPNGGDGLLIDGSAHGNVIGGSLRSVIPQNTFSGNRGYGVEITGRAHDNRVFTSFIGTEILGTTALPNRKGGVLVSGRAYANVIGVSRLLPVNLISGNIGNGVTLGPGTSLNVVVGNFIGLNRIGGKLPNTGKPVVNRGRHNVVRGNRT